MRALADSGWRTACGCAQGVGVELQRAAGGLGQRLARQIVGRRAKSAGGQDHVGPGDRLAKHLDAGRQFVADGGMIEHADAQLLEPLAEPLGVRVERLAADDFVADGDDFGIHGQSSCHVTGGTALAQRRACIGRSPRPSFLRMSHPNIFSMKSRRKTSTGPSAASRG